VAFVQPEIGLRLTTVPWASLGSRKAWPSGKQETLGFFLLASNHYARCFNMVTWGKFYIYHYLYVYYLKKLKMFPSSAITKRTKKTYKKKKNSLIHQ
jgi:hypothetical protein